MINALASNNQRLFEPALLAVRERSMPRLPLALCIVGLMGPLLASAQAGQRPNILFIYLDDFGWRDTGYMGSDFYETPHLDALAHGGMYFTNAYACAANCAPSRACLLSGQYTPRHEVFNVGTRPRGSTLHRRLKIVPGTTTLNLDITTWAEVLQQAGYRTGMFGKWHLGNTPQQQGFDEAVDHRDLDFKGHLGADGTYLSDALTDRAIDFIQRNKHRSWCVYLPHFAVHTPLQPKADLLAKYQQKPAGKLHKHTIMATMIQSVDDATGRLLAALDEMDLRKNTVIVFSSDNGGYGPATDMDPLWGYKGTYYEGGIRVPMFVNWPGRVAPNQVCEDPVIGVDIYPTLISIAGASTPNQPLDGLDLLPRLTGEAQTLEERPLFWHFPAYLQSYGNQWIREQRDPLFRTRPCSIIRLGDYKLHEYFETGDVELYDLRNDVRERKNLAKEMPDRAKRLHAMLRAWQSQIHAPIPRTPNLEFDAASERDAIQRPRKGNQPRKRRNKCEPSSGV